MLPMVAAAVSGAGALARQLQPAPARAAAKALARPGARGRRNTWVHRVLGGWKRRVTSTLSNSMWLACIGLLIFGDTTAMTQMGAAMSDTASAVGVAAVASADVIAAGANATASVLSTGVRTLSTAAHAAAEIWRGVDILDLEVEVTALQAVARNRQAMVPHWQRNLTTAGWDPAVVSAVVRCVSGETLAMEAEVTLVQVNRSWTRVRCRALVLGTGVAAMAGELTALRYRLQWANPLWELAGLDPAQEEQQILKRVVQAAGAVRPAESGPDFSDQALRGLATAVELPPRWRLLHRALSAAAAALNATAAAGPAPWLAAILAVVACQSARASQGAAAGGPGADGAAQEGGAAASAAGAGAGAAPAEAEVEGFCLINEEGCA